MAGIVAGLHVFGPDTGPENLSLLDGNYSALQTAINSLNTFGNYYLDTGAANAMNVATVAGQSAALSAGLPVQILAAATNTSKTPTLNVFGLGAQTIKDANGNPLMAGSIQAGALYQFQFDGTAWRILNPTTSLSDPLILHAVKQANTTRISTTVLANDPDLVIAIPYAGFWKFELLALFYATTTATMGISSGINYSGTFVAAASFYGMIAMPVAGTAVGPVQTSSPAAAVTTPNAAMQLNGAISTVAAAPNFLQVTGTLEATGAGNIGYSWAQFNSTAQNLNMLAGSYLLATQLA